jgi:hypothetical protein
LTMISNPQTLEQYESVKALLWLLFELEIPHTEEATNDYIYEVGAPWEVCECGESVSNCVCDDDNSYRGMEYDDEASFDE